MLAFFGHLDQSQLFFILGNFDPFQAVLTTLGLIWGRLALLDHLGLIGHLSLLASWPFGLQEIDAVKSSMGRMDWSLVKPL